MVVGDGALIVKTVSSFVEDLLTFLVVATRRTLVGKLECRTVVASRVVAASGVTLFAITS